MRSIGHTCRKCFPLNMASRPIIDFQMVLHPNCVWNFSNKMTLLAVALLVLLEADDPFHVSDMARQTAGPERRVSWKVSTVRGTPSVSISRYRLADQAEQRNSVCSAVSASSPQCRHCGLTLFRMRCRYASKHPWPDNAGMRWNDTSPYVREYHLLMSGSRR